MIVTSCLVSEYACFADKDCRKCLAALYATDDARGHNGSKTTALRMPECSSENTLYLIDTVQQNCVNGNGGFPICSFRKQQCASMPQCKSCLTTLGTGDGAEAARQCREIPHTYSDSSLALDNVVNVCTISNTASCRYWRQRCADIPECNVCLASMGNTNNLGDTVADLSTSACQHVFTSTSPLGNEVYVGYINMLDAIAAGCPGISMCRKTVAGCAVQYGPLCLACINGSEAPAETTFCSELLQHYSFDTACEACPASVHTINSIVFATAMVGGASAAACIWVATTIVAHGHDRVSMRDRVVVGLMITNALYSVANAIPLNALRAGVIDCGRLAMSFDTIRLGRALWFCGKYGLVSFELLILGASIHALLRGMSFVPPRTEAAMHAACYAVAAAAFAVFYVLCARINNDGYSANTESEACVSPSPFVNSDVMFCEHIALCSTRVSLLQCECNTCQQENTHDWLVSQSTLVLLELQPRACAQCSQPPSCLHTHTHTHTHTPSHACIRLQVYKRSQSCES
jgi:hypothetical protein